MRSGVEHSSYEVALEHESPQRLGVGATKIGPVGDDVVERSSDHHLRREHALRGAFGDETRDADERVAFVDARKRDEALGLERVVELFAEALFHDREVTLRVEPSCADHPAEALEDRCAREIALDRLLDPRMLDLYRDLDFLVTRAMDLPDRSA